MASQPESSNGHSLEVSSEELNSFSALPSGFYDRDTDLVARSLVGKVVLRNSRHRVLAGRIVETEAYLGMIDPACHLWRGFTPRTRGTFGNPGVAYVFLIYGIYHCLNAATLSRWPYGCVLIRALEPIIVHRSERKNNGNAARRMDGPGKLTRTLGIDSSFNGHELFKPPLMIVDGKSDYEITQGPRVGISRAKDWSLRFMAKDNQWASYPRLR